MSAANQAKGKRWEADLLAYLRDYGHDAEALRLAGTKDQGDIVVRLPDRQWRVIIEAKDTAFTPAQFIGEARDEANHYAEARGFPRERVLPVAVVKRRKANTGRAYVLIQLDELMDFLGRE